MAHDNSTLAAAGLITISAAQLPLKLTKKNYPSWRAQILPLLIGCDLVGYLDGQHPCPAKTITQAGSEVPNPKYNLWIRQDQLILHAIIASVTEAVISAISLSKTSQEAWTTLSKLYANSSRSRLMSLKEQLSRLSKGSKSIADYMGQIKAISDDLTIIGSLLDEIDLVIHTLNGLGQEFKEISAAIRARETSISFEDLYDKLQEHERYLLREDTNLDSAVPTANYVHKPQQQNYRGGRQNYRGGRGRNQQQQRPNRYPQQQNAWQQQNHTSPRTTHQQPWQQNSNQQQQSWQPQQHQWQQSYNSVICQLCDRPGHSARNCRTTSRSPVANFTASDVNSNPAWLVDSGASHHVTSDLQNLSIYSDYDGTDELMVGNGDGLPVTHTGHTSISTPTGSFVLSNVLCVPQIKRNLLSVSQFCHTNKASIEFFPTYFVVKDLRTGAPLLRGTNKDGVYELASRAVPTAMALTTTRTSNWHDRLGHPSSRTLDYIFRYYFSAASNTSNKLPCNACSCNKSHRLPFFESSLRSSRPLELIYTDVWGPAPITSIDDYRYYVIFVDHFTKYVWLYPLKRKSDVAVIFPRFKQIVEVFFKHTIRCLYSDGGGEFRALSPFLNKHGISHLLTPPHTPQHNGAAERRHRHIVETGLTLLHHANAPLSLWSHAFQTAVYLINRLPTPIIDHYTPYELIFNERPNYNKLRVFGCLCYPWLKPYNKHKLEPKSRPCVFIGYSLQQSAYRCFDPNTNKVFVSRHVQFFEDVFPYRTGTSAAIPALQPSVLDQWDPPISTQPLIRYVSVSGPATVPTAPPAVSPTVPAPAALPAPAVAAIPVAVPAPATPIPPPEEQQPAVPAAAPRTHPMTTRAQNNIFKPKKMFAATKHPLPDSIEPSSATQALKEPHWRAAMLDEFNALVQNGTWELVPPRPHMNIVGNKWVFRIKRNPDGSVERYKARLVAKGFHQRPGIDYKETFSPVVKPTTVRLVLSLAVSFGWSLRQLDINNAFLQGSLRDEVYMAQPTGFVDPDSPTAVCRLRKAIYGLKQAPRAWFIEFRSYLVSYGFKNSLSDASLFIYNRGQVRCFVLVYVDDIIVTGSSNRFISQFIGDLSLRFSLKDLGPLHYFLGVEVLRTATGIFLSQAKYIRDLLARTGMDGAKPMATPLATKPPLVLHDGSPPADPKQFRSVVGALQYLSFTRPDIGFTVNRLSQFMHQPTELHWTAVKRLLRYLKGTLHHGLFFRAGSPLRLRVFSDADHAADLDNRTSTTAYLVYLGNNVISWSSHKQQCVARSSTEAEYHALADAAAESIWVRHLLRELGILLPAPPILYCDNLGATLLSANPVFHSRMKHIAVAYHFVRSIVQKGLLHVRHIFTTDQLADVLTKPLFRGRFEVICSKIGLLDGSSFLRGRIRDKG